MVNGGVPPCPEIHYIHGAVHNPNHAVASSCVSLHQADASLHSFASLIPRKTRRLPLSPSPVSPSPGLIPVITFSIDQRQKQRREGEKMSAKLLYSLSDENPNLQKQVGCINGIFHLFERQQFLIGRSTNSPNHKQLPQGQSNNYEHKSKDAIHKAKVRISNPSAKLNKRDFNHGHPK
ncbi:hypothetical protein Nepgr_022199 [Nepenthes gracilis]|uniref:Uncharacterized protein n=1 Tax=Nepenthes gracilis TaxID=150966 RepID=A0AAD3SYB4_NEPGR|nr:hypothetical protein Nepgr_022199 [Nepenthes gracilis]